MTNIHQRNFRQIWSQNYRFNQIQRLVTTSDTMYGELLGCCLRRLNKIFFTAIKPCASVTIKSIIMLFIVIFMCFLSRGKCPKSNFKPVHIILHFRSFHLVVLQMNFASKLSEERFLWIERCCTDRRFLF